MPRPSLHPCRLCYCHLHVGTRLLLLQRAVTIVVMPAACRPREECLGHGLSSAPLQAPSSPPQARPRRRAGVGQLVRLVGEGEGV